MPSKLATLFPRLLDYNNPASMVSHIRRKRFAGLKRQLEAYQQDKQRRIT